MMILNSLGKTVYAISNALGHLEPEVDVIEGMDVGRFRYTFRPQKILRSDLLPIEKNSRVSYQVADRRNQNFESQAMYPIEGRMVPFFGSSPGLRDSTVYQKGESGHEFLYSTTNPEQISNFDDLLSQQLRVMRNSVEHNHFVDPRFDFYASLLGDLKENYSGEARLWVDDRKKTNALGRIIDNPMRDEKKITIFVNNFLNSTFPRRFYERAQANPQLIADVYNLNEAMLSRSIRNTERHLRHPIKIETLFQQDAA